MSMASIVLAHAGGARSVHTAAVTAGAGATTTVIADPGDGYKIVVLGGTVTVNAAGTCQFFHTSASGGQELTGVMTLAAGVQYQIPPMQVPASALVCIQAVTGNVRGSIVYAVCED